MYPQVRDITIKNNNMTNNRVVSLTITSELEDDKIIMTKHVASITEDLKKRKKNLL